MGPKREEYQDYDKEPEVEDELYDATEIPDTTGPQDDYEREVSRYDRKNNGDPRPLDFN